MKIAKIILVSALLMIGSADLAKAQDQQGFWTYYKAGNGTCPTIGIRAARNANRIVGTAFVLNGPSSTLDGTIDMYNRFHIIMKPTQRGAPVGTIDGELQANHIHAVIAGSGCTDGPFDMALSGGY